MIKWIIHGVIFLTVSGIVASTFWNVKDDADAFLQLPALMLAGVYIGVLVVFYALPLFTHNISSLFYNSGEQLEPSLSLNARLARSGEDYQEAISIYLGMADDDPSDPSPWIEIAEIQHEDLEDTAAAIDTLSNALENQEWPVDDAANYMSRIAELTLENPEERESAISILQQIVETFPATRHCANATEKLREIGEI